MAFYLNFNKEYILKNKAGIKASDKKLITDFINKYKLPKPRINLGRKLYTKNLAGSLTDISDGIYKDIFNVAGAGCGCRINVEDIPVNEELKQIAGILNIDNYIDDIISFGEDYELLWTFGREYTGGELMELKDSCGTNVKKIGFIDENSAKLTLIKDGKVFLPEDHTFRHL